MQFKDLELGQEFKTISPTMTKIRSYLAMSSEDNKYHEIDDDVEVVLITQQEKKSIVYFKDIAIHDEFHLEFEGLHTYKKTAFGATCDTDGVYYSMELTTEVYPVKKTDKVEVKLKFKPKDRVKKVGGSYQAPGTIVGDGTTSLDKTLYMFEFDGLPGMVHIFGESQLDFLIEES